MHAVLYHHGIVQRRNLLTVASREWLASQRLPAAAREQLDIALHVIDALELMLAPFDRELRAMARQQPGARALVDAFYGVGELTAVTIIAELR
jgi:transposase